MKCKHVWERAELEIRLLFKGLDVMEFYVYELISIAVEKVGTETAFPQVRDLVRLIGDEV